MGLLAAFVVRVATALVALVIAEIVLDGFSIRTIAYPIVAIIFAVLMMVLRPAFDRLLEDRGRLVAALAGLAAAFVALIVTDVLTGDVSVDGVGTWILASVIVWVAGLVADLVLGAWLFRRIAGRERVRRPERGRTRR